MPTKLRSCPISRVLINLPHHPSSCANSSKDPLCFNHLETPSLTMWFSSYVAVSTVASLCFTRGVDASINVRRSDIYSIFTHAQWSFNTTISYPGSSNFTASTERWSIFDLPTFSAAITPATEGDVVQAVGRKCRLH